MKNIFFLLLISFMFSGCYKPTLDRWETLEIKEGNHRSSPYDLTWNDDVNKAYKWKFTESCEYDLSGIDQCDWNKLTGASVNLLTNHENSLMIGWRWDLSGHYWIAPYYHKDGRNFFASASCDSGVNTQNIDANLVALKVVSGQEFQSHITTREDLGRIMVTIILPGTGETSFFELEIDDGFGNTREIYPWFGGNESAPQDMEILRCLIGAE